MSTKCHDTDINISRVNMDTQYCYHCKVFAIKIFHSTVLILWRLLTDEPFSVDLHRNISPLDIPWTRSTGPQQVELTPEKNINQTFQARSFQVDGTGRVQEGSVLGSWIEPWRAREEWRLACSLCKTSESWWTMLVKLLTVGDCKQNTTLLCFWKHH